MKDPETGSLLASAAPLMAGMVPLITLLFFIPGIVYGIVAGKIKNDKDVAALLYESMAGMGSYIKIIKGVKEHGSKKESRCSG